MRYQQQYTQDAATISGFAQRFMAEGKQQDEARLLLRLLTARFGAVPTTTREVIESADAETLYRISYTHLITAETQTHDETRNH